MPPKISPKKKVEIEYTKRPESASVETPATDVSSEFSDMRILPRKQKTRKPFMGGVVVIIVLVAIAGLAGYALNSKSLWSQKSQKKFHAVFLSNGQVYFGTIKQEDRENLTLENVFYVQMIDQQVPSEVEGEAPRTVQVPQLVRKGDEFYGPANTIRINRDQITVVEELTEGSQVLKDIQARLQQP